MEQTIIKIVENASSSKVTIMDNVPNPPFRKPTIAENKASKQFRMDCATRFFQQRKNQQARYTSSLQALVDHGIISQKSMNYSMRKWKHSGFMACVQQGILDTQGGGKNYSKSNYTKRKRLRTKGLWQLVKNNFNHTNAAYATLTFDPSKVIATDLDVVLKCFRNFILRVRKQYDNFKYIAVFARQTNRNWHFHMLHNARCMTWQELQCLWKHGFVQQDRPSTDKDVNNITKYLDENMQEEAEELQGKKGYLCSKNLNKPRVLRSWREDEVDECLEKFEALSKQPYKFLAYEKEKETGAMVQFSYPEGRTEAAFLDTADINKTEEPLTILQAVTSSFSAVTVYHNQSDPTYFTLAHKK